MNARIFAGAAAEALARDVLALAARWPPDLVVRDGVEFGGCLAAEALGLPTPSAASLLRAAGDRAGPLRRAPGGAAGGPRPAADPELRMHQRYLSVVPTIPGLVRPDQAVAPVVHFLRPVPFDQSGAERLPDWPRLAGPAGAADGLRLARHHLQPQPRPARRDPRRPARRAAHPHPHRRAQPGPGRLRPAAGQRAHRALRAADAAAPVLRPRRHPRRLQHRPGGPRPGAAAGRRAARRGPAGQRRRLRGHGGGAGGPAEERTPEAIRDAVRAVLGDPAYRATAERVRGEMAALPGPEYAVALLERLARDKQPLVAR